LAVNVVLGEWRSRARRTARVSTVENIPDPEVVPSEMNPEMSMDLERAIASLPSGARTVFVLHDIEGYRHSEIAELTDTAPGTSKAQLHWARKQLREMLGK
jgi:RNA polymerase sigma-70 factor (ECF subfamily)